MSIRNLAGRQRRAMRGLMAIVFFSLAASFCPGQDVPPELAFLNTAPLKAYHTTYEPWAYIQMPPGNYGANGAGKMVGGKQGYSRHRHRRQGP